MIEHLPQPQPDVERLKAVLRRQVPDRVPLVELAIAEEVLAELNGRPLAPLPPATECGGCLGTHAGMRDWARDRVMLWHRLGYDYYRVRVEIPFHRDVLPAADTAAAASGDRSWSNENQGVIQTREDFDRYPWPRREDLGFAQAEAAIACLPPGMGAIGFSGGVLEWATAIMGLETFMLALYDDVDLARDVVDNVGRIILEAFEVFCGMPEVFALWLGDDMGFKTSTLISPEHLREYILPWHKRYADLAHQTGRLFMLHSCGNIEPVMPDLIDTVGIDARHSYEDVIVPVEKFKSRWGDRVAVLGGVDVDMLSRSTPDRVRQRTREILDTCAPAGGYACGSGNSIPNYVPAANYLAMVETIHQFNGRM
jgi:uroporphyrinogen decarboxylase